MKCFSMFSGIGGFDLALRNLNHTIVGACEIDRYARQVYGRHFPGIKIYENATTIKPEELPDFDILAAGFPCQAFSIAGKRRGFADTRGSLFFEIARVAKEKRPSILLLENVKGLLSHDKGNTFKTIINTLDEIGYDAEWQVLNSKYFVPQNRERVFIIGHFRGERTRQIFPLGFSHEESTTQSKIKILGNKNPSGRGQSGIIYDSNGLSPTLQAGTGEHQNSQGYIAVVKDHGKLRELKDNKSNMIGANYFKGADNRGQRTLITWSKSGRDWGVESRITEAKTTMIMNSNKNSNCKNRVQERDETWALTGNSNDFSIMDDLRVRRLTPLECERLQGFPDNWTKYDNNGKEISDTQRYKMCGNAVTVPVIEYIISNYLL